MKKRVVAKAKKRRRRNRQPLAGDRYFRQLQSRKLERERTDEPELTAEDIRLRAIKRANEARDK